MAFTQTAYEDWRIERAKVKARADRRHAAAMNRHFGRPARKASIWWLLAIIALPLVIVIVPAFN